MSTSNVAVVKSGGFIANNAGLIAVGRLLLSLIFILAGYSKLTGIAGTAGWFGSIGLPFPTVVAVLVGLLELLGGLAILVGYKTRIAAVALALFTIAATLIAHLDFSDQVQILFFQKNLAIAGGLAVLAAFGAGALSIDGRRG
jgi:putative oxidoreductase